MKSNTFPNNKDFRLVFIIETLVDMAILFLKLNSKLF